MVAPKKSLGQNFLRDENIARKIVDHVGSGRDDLVVEIGPGNGALTKHLVATGAEVVVIEIDARAVAMLRETFGAAITIVHSDVLAVDLQKMKLKHGRPLHVVGNIPYYITSDIIFWLFGNRQHAVDATIMVQLEVAQRLAALPGTKEYGILTVFAQYYSRPKFLFKVSPNCFYPKPNVDSAVIWLDFTVEPPPVDERLFRTVVRGTFGKRRKTLFNGLRYLGFAESDLNRVAVDLTRRPEQLTLHDFLTLVDQLQPYANQQVLGTFSS